MTLLLDTPSLSADQVVEDLRQQVADGFAAAIPPGPVSLVDFPDYGNVGDSLIWLGQMAWLDAQGRTPAYVSACRDFSVDDLKAAAPEGPILINGGGNFGSLWRKHELLRLTLLRAFPGRPIIQLPQSIHYADPAQAAEIASAIRDHGAFTLLVRDARTLAFARETFDCETRLCPDAALCLGRLPRQAPSADIMALLRTDNERVEDAMAPPPGTISNDWIKEDPGALRRMRIRIKLHGLLAAGTQAKRLRRQRMLARWRMERGIAMLSQGRVVVTDRLHAHILSLLLDIPHVALDNSYGKVGAFAAQWTDRYAGFRRATTRSEAFALARDLLNA